MHRLKGTGSNKSLTLRFQDLRKLACVPPSVGAHSYAPLLYVAFVRKSWICSDNALVFIITLGYGRARAFVLIGKGLLDLGRNLTPLPYPKEDGQLVRSDVYGVVQHPLYSSLIFATLSWVVFQVSLSQLIAAALLFAFVDAKARREEAWLTEKHPEYSQYQERDKRLIPGLY